MEPRNRSSVAFGLLLILVGAWLLAERMVPAFDAWLEANFAWPFYMIGGGVLLLIFGLAAGEPGMAMPATVLAGIGGLLYWQTINNNFASWAYAWALIPGFVGFGLLLTGLLDRRQRDQIQSGGWLMLISIVLFFMFGSIVGGNDLLGPYWPVLLIGFGLLLLVQSILSKS